MRPGGRALGATDDDHLAGVMGGSVQHIDAFIAAREDELFEED